MSSSHADLIASVLSAPGDGTGGELKVALTRLSREVKERTERGSSDSQDFFMAAIRALARVKGTAHAELRMGCLLDSGQYFYRTGRPAAAIECSHLINELAERTKNQVWLRKACNLAGIVHAEAGDVAEGVIWYAKALQIARTLDDPSSEVAVYISLSTALNYAALHKEALDCCHKAADLSSANHFLPLLAKSYTNMAQCYLYLEEYAQGLAAIEDALAVTAEANNAEEAFARSIREFTYVQLALEDGKIALAREHSATCRRYSHWGENPRCRVLADITAGLCEIHGGNANLGLAYLHSALENSTDFALRIDALTALVKTYDEMNRPELALKHMTELLSSVRTARENSIRALLAVSEDAKFSRAIAMDMGDFHALERREANLRARVAERRVTASRLDMLERLAITADLKEEASGEHGFRVGQLSALLAEKLGLKKETCSAIKIAGRLHDIGKLGVPDRILLNSKELREAERHFMSTHTVIGAELLAESDFPQLRMAEEVARCHHEWWDGSGYPNKLAGKRIPIHARIVALCDVFDALTHGRPYAEPWPIIKALEEIRMRRGTQFDPDITDRFLEMMEQLRATHSDIDVYLAKGAQQSPFLQARNKIKLMLNEERKNLDKEAISGAETVH